VNELPEQFVFAEDPAGYQDGQALVVRIPGGIRSKQKLLAVYADKLHFPPYFGWNWDALYDCLCERLNASRRPVAIVHADLPFGEASEYRRVYLGLLRDVASRTCGANDNSLAVVFPASLKDAILTVREE
jgi:RNAse (barnase) inhibitor barstar